MTDIRAADLKPGDGLIWLGERRVVEAVHPATQKPELVGVHFIGLAAWQIMSADRQLKVFR